MGKQYCNGWLLAKTQNTREKRIHEIATCTSKKQNQIIWLHLNDAKMLPLQIHNKLKPIQSYR